MTNTTYFHQVVRDEASPSSSFSSAASFSSPQQQDPPVRKPSSSSFSISNVIRKAGAFLSRQPELEGAILQERKLTFQDIVKATWDFNSVMIVGSGSYRTVYKAVLQDGTTLAVKKVQPRSVVALSEYVNEVRTLESLKNKNIVHLLGWCAGYKQLLLIYEYMENNSLQEAITDTKLKILSWETRFRICLQIASGLVYLHKIAEPKIIHRDIKASNILLDGDLNAKISDFGLARFYHEEQGSILTKLLGTHGYMAPEYALRGILSEKADVYSYGVVVLEIISGRSNATYTANQEFEFLLDEVYILKNEGNPLGIIDAAIRNKPGYNAEQASKLLTLVIMCTSFSPALRPTMSEVVSVLEGVCAIEELSACNQPKLTNDSKNSISFISQDRPERQPSSFSFSSSTVTHEAPSAVVSLRAEHEGIVLQERKFTFQEIMKATQDFNPDMEIGSGGSGIIYKAVLQDGSAVAVKKIQSCSVIGLSEYLNEVFTLQSLRNENLVQLLGWCTGDDQLLLIYEYMKKSSLQKAFFDAKSEFFSWETRFRICLQIADGLVYLHAKPKIIHIDINPSNILLDENLNAKISDFGLATFHHKNQGASLTKLFGTYGYMAPEYALRGILSEKTDVYSYGVVVLEIISGRSNAAYNSNHECGCLLDEVNYLKNEGNPLDLIDATIINQPGYNTEQASKLLTLAIMCINQAPSLRPTMSEVVSVLEGVKTIEELSASNRPKQTNDSKRNITTAVSHITRMATYWHTLS